MIQNVVFKLADTFPEYDWDVDYKEKIGKYEIIVNDFDFYFSKRFKNFIRVLRIKYKSVKFYCVYKKYVH